MEVAVPAENLKPTLPIHSKDCVDDVVGALGLLRVANAPVLDQLKLDETFLDAELALVLIELVHVVE